jgi:hypothetical protein
MYVPECIQCQQFAKDYAILVVINFISNQIYYITIYVKTANMFAIELKLNMLWYRFSPNENCIRQVTSGKDLERILEIFE